MFVSTQLDLLIISTCARNKRHWKGKERWMRDSISPLKVGIFMDFPLQNAVISFQKRQHRLGPLALPTMGGSGTHSTAIPGLRAGFCVRWAIFSSKMDIRIYP